VENQIITEDILQQIGFKNICFDWWDYKFNYSPYTLLRYDFKTKNIFVNGEQQRNKIFTIWELEMTLIFNRAWDDRIDFNKFLNKHNN
jgi:hypothetical protein